MNIERTFLQHAINGNLEKLNQLLDDREKGKINFNTEITSDQFDTEPGSVNVPLHNNALHLACRNGRDRVIQQLLVKIPSLIEKRNSFGYTPLLTLISSVNYYKTTTSNITFEFFLKHAVLTVVDNYRYNLFHHLAILPDTSKLKLALEVFQYGQTVYSTLATTSIPTVLVDLIKGYNGFYSRSDLLSLLTSKNARGHTPVDLAAPEAKPLLQNLLPKVQSANCDH